MLTFFQKMAFYPRRIPFTLCLATFIFVCDQLCKWWMIEILFKAQNLGVASQGFFEWLLSGGERLGPMHIELLPFFNLVMVWNKGVSFGMFAGDDSSGAMILIATSLIITAFLLFWLLTVHEKSIAVAISVIIGGALGNVHDRARFGAVADFFDFHFLGWHYPAFNIADCAIVLGVAYIVLHGLFMSKSDNKNKDNKENEVSSNN